MGFIHSIDFTRRLSSLYLLLHLILTCRGERLLLLLDSSIVAVAAVPITVVLTIATPIAAVATALAEIVVPATALAAANSGGAADPPDKTTAATTTAATATTAAILKISFHDQHPVGSIRITGLFKQ